MSIHTRSQRLAQAAYAQIAILTHNGTRKPEKEFVSTAKKFPALIHTCGLAQAVAFALAKKDEEYLGYLAAVLKAAGHPKITDHRKLDEHARKEPMTVYLRLSRDAIDAASWLKRYVEAAEEDA
ncbi:MAG: type III-B CRISPR module-associated protein Cmr5 [Thermogutta sp.]